MNKANNFVGQPVLSQILSCIPDKIIADAAKKHQSNKSYKKIPVRVHLISLLYGVFSYCNGLRELCEGMLACEGKLAHLGLDKAPPKSTLSDANNRRSYMVMETIYYQLLQRYHSFISDTRLKGLSIKNLKVIDSTTMSLFTDILRGVGRNPMDGSRKKGGIKVHAMMDAFSGVTEFVRMTAAKVHDKQFLYRSKLPSDSFVVFDKAYNLYSQYTKWTKQSVWFVTRMKENAVYHVTKVITDNTKKKVAKGVLKEQYVTIGYKERNGRNELFKTEKNRI